MVLVGAALVLVGMGGIMRARKFIGGVEERAS
jgi:hypothetical protein